MRSVLMSINPEWVKKIMSGEKKFEVRKRAPLTRHPYKVYVYCTKGGEEILRKHSPYKLNGTVCGEFMCVSTTERSAPWHNNMYGTCLTAQQLCNYAGGGKLCYMAIENPILYDKPKNLADFNISRPPQSWQYID